MTDYILVPVEPTPEMVKVGQDAANGLLSESLVIEVFKDMLGEYKAIVAASPALQVEPEWIPTNGREPDLLGSTLVDVKFANGHLSIGRRVDYWIWMRDGHSSDITHYRIHRTATTV